MVIMVSCASTSFVPRLRVRTRARAHKPPYDHVDHVEIVA